MTVFFPANPGDLLVAGTRNTHLGAVGFQFTIKLRNHDASVIKKPQKNKNGGSERMTEVHGEMRIWANHFPITAARIAMYFELTFFYHCSLNTRLKSHLR